MIYLDNSATTRPCPEAVAAMTNAMTENWGNPSALYNFGIDIAHALRDARSFKPSFKLSSFTLIRGSLVLCFLP